MKLHHLTFEGIGPFRNRTELDFARLGASGLFLLEGNTGTGKSTIIDALVFALYGNVAGENSSDDRIRSQFMPPNKPSYVDLFFEVPSGIYRIRRTPAYMRPKLRGAGEKRENATAKIWKINSPEVLAAAITGNEQANDVEPVVSRTDEAGRFIAEALGLTHAQFTQTVVLPQGEFARFLKAGTRDRKAVLEKVFGTQFYQVIENEFKDARIAAKKEADTSRAKLCAGFERVIEAAAFTDEQRDSALADAGEFTPNGIDAATRSGEHALAEAHNAHVAAVENEKTAKARVHEAEKARAALEKMRGLIGRRRALDDKIARRDCGKETARHAAQLLARHDAAEQVFYALVERDKAQQRQSDAALHLPEAMREAPETWAQALEEAEKAHESLSRQESELSSLVKREEAFPALCRQHAQAVNAVAKAREAKVHADAAVSERPTERAALTTRKTELAVTAGKSDGLLAEANEWKTKMAAAERAIDKEKHLNEVTQQVPETAAEAQRALAHVTKLRQSRIDAMAIELAEKLADGDPCPVCGSADHPHPATASGELVNDEAIDAADRIRAEKEAVLQRLTERAAALKAEMMSAREIAGGGEEASAREASNAELADVARTRHAAAHAAYEAAVQAKKELASVESALEHFDARTVELTNAAATAAAQLERAVASEESLAVQVAAERTALDEARGTHRSVAARQAELHKRAAEEEIRVRTLRTAELARAQHTELAEAANTRIAESTFDTEIDARAARLTQDRKKELTATVNAHALLESQIAEESTDPELSQVDASAEHERDVQEQLEAAIKALHVARETHTEAVARASEYASTARRTRAALESFQEIVTEHERTSSRHNAVVHLANIATGGSADTQARLTLSTFAVMRRFEKVVEAANSRLGTLGDGNLELALAPLKQSGNTHVGLDLDIVDRRTDAHREPTTLSGGETFYVSLALALGLADVVMAESGGTEMNTLFIDEGFGSLDPEKLDGVITEIRHLSQHGRTVGIVSHVAELKTQIAEKIHVSRTHDGTSVATVTA